MHHDIPAADLLFFTRLVLKFRARTRLPLCACQERAGRHLLRHGWPH